MSKLFLISASNPLALSHLKDTLDIGVSIEEIRHFLGKEEELKLENTSENTLRIWGTKKGKNAINLTTWNKINRGDYCLFYNNKKYIRSGKIYHKTANKKLAERLWGTDNGETWELIYFIENWKKIDVDKNIVHNYLGYSKNFYLQGFMCPDKIRQNNLKFRFGSIENFVETVSTQDFDALKMNQELQEEIDNLVREEIEKEKRKFSNSDWKSFLKDEIQRLIKDSAPRYIVTKTKSIERNPNLYERIKAYYDYKCQVDESHRFEHKDGGYYAEVHHIVPLSKCLKEDENNILVLCPSCHKKFHFGSKEVIRELVKKLPEPQKSAVKKYHGL